MKLRDKLLVPIGVAFIGIAGIHLATVEVAGRSWEQVERVRVQGHADVQQVRVAQVAFQRQVQEWKNMLLRGSTDEGYRTYRAAFEAREAEVEAQLDAIAAQSMEGPTRELARRLREEHARLGRAYRAAIGDAASLRATDAREIDASVRGVDRPLSTSFDDLAAGVMRRADGRTAAASSVGARNEWVLLLASLGLSVLLGLVLVLVTHRLVVRPAQQAEEIARRLLDAIHGDVPHLEADLASIVTDLPDDELGRLAHRLLDAGELLTRERRHHQQLRDQMARLHAQALRADDARDAILATVTHELRTPLHGVLGSLELLDDGRLNAEQVSLTRAAYESGARLASLVEDILEISHVSSDGDVELDVETVELDRALAGVVAEADAAGQAAFSGCRVSLSIAPGGPRRVRTDGRRLERMVRALVKNGMAASPGGTVDVVLTTAEVGGNVRVRIDVVDDGHGVSEADLKQIFEPFVQAASGFDRSKQGAGLGLTMCRNLARKLGGDLHHESGPTGGSCFWIDLVLPAASAASKGASLDPRAIAPQVDDEETGDSAFRVLVLGDIPPIVLETLRATDARVDVVSDVSDALIRLSDTHVDVLLADAYRVGLGMVDDLRDRSDTAGSLTAFIAMCEEGERDRALEVGWDDVLSASAQADDTMGLLDRWGLLPTLLHEGDRRTA